jgi:hypothetical protein
MFSCKHLVLMKRQSYIIWQFREEEKKIDAYLTYIQMNKKERNVIKVIVSYKLKMKRIMILSLCHSGESSDSREHSQIPKFKKPNIQICYPQFTQVANFLHSKRPKCYFLNAKIVVNSVTIQRCFFIYFNCHFVLMAL